jgi:photosystem II stability/assembly factor-like uncharacterized protein
MRHKQIEVYAGTAGHSVWFSSDRGRSWVHPNSHSGMYLEARVWCISSHPDAPRWLYAGTDMGLFRWDELATRWAALPSPMSEIWSVVQDPSDPTVLLAGARPAGLFRSIDGGQSWARLEVPGLQLFSEVNMGPTRVTQILFDPLDAGTVWATIEIGGVFRSVDSGRSWISVVSGLQSIDVHGIAVTRNRNGGKLVFATTNRGLHRSADNGLNWTFQALDSEWQYTRAIVVQPSRDGEPENMFLTNGNGPPGSTGRLLRSRDSGSSWQALELPGTLNSTPWCLAMHPSDPELMFLATNLGQLFTSDDGGEHWERLAREFGEVRALHWRPVAYPADRPPHSVTVRSTTVF